MNADDQPMPPSGAAIVVAWVEALQGDDDPRVLWSLLDDDLKVALVQGWMMHNAPNMAARTDRDEVARATALHWADPALLEAMLDDLKEHWRAVYADLQGEFGVVAGDRIAGVDLEFIILTAAEYIGHMEAEVAIPAHTFIVRRDGASWIIAANARRLPVPGWPPSEREVPGLD